MRAVLVHRVTAGGRRRVVVVNMFEGGGWWLVWCQLVDKLLGGAATQEGGLVGMCLVDWMSAVN